VSGWPSRRASGGGLSSIPLAKYPEKFHAAMPILSGIGKKEKIQQYSAKTAAFYQEANLPSFVTSAFGGSGRPPPATRRPLSLRRKNSTTVPEFSFPDTARDRRYTDTSGARS
jgi:hypothetical protein